MDQVNLQEWAMSPEAQPFLQQVGYGQPQAGGFGGGMGGGGYSDYLRSTINNNQANPAFQQSMMGTYMDSLNPANQYSMAMNQQEEQRRQRDTDLQMAIELMSSGSPEGVQLGNSILSGYYGDQLGPEAFAPAPQQSFGDYTRGGAETQLGAMQLEPGAPQDEFNWLNYLSQASDPQIQAYQEPVGTWDYLTGLSDILGENSFWENRNPFRAFGRGEEISRKKAGYFGQ